jgi:type III restriction enzyme
VRTDAGSQQPFPRSSLIVGISATPQRFDALLQAAGDRTRYAVTVPTEAIRLSGLIKDRIEIGSPEAGQNPDTMLGEACRKLSHVSGEWAEYAGANGLRAIRPILLVQVEDKAGAGSISRTNLDQVIETLRQYLPDLSPTDVVHCFGEEQDVMLRSGWRIARERPDAIQTLERVRVVLFKTALNTGWDCPRAEVMMSYRTAHDPTLIAQLVGRMVRTPLAQRIPGNDVLNTAYLYLPFYDDEELDAVVRSLTSDAEGVPSEVARERAVLETAPRPGSEQLLQALSRLPNEAVPAAKPTPDLKRLFAFARALEQDGLADDCVAEATQEGVDHIAAWLARASSEEGSLQAQLSHLEQLTYAVFAYAEGELVETDRHTVAVTESDIDRLYRTVSAQVSPEIAGRWIRFRYGQCEPLRAKAEFVAFTADTVARTALDVIARTRLGALEARYGDAIRDLARPRVEHYNDLRRSGRHVQLTTLIAPSRITFPLAEAAVPVSGHLYVRTGTHDEFRTALNTWESAVIASERARPDFLAWHRNLPRKPWSLSYSYEFNGLKPGYPDFLVFRRSPSGGVLVDILEPHQGEDSTAKALGLAHFCNTPRRSFDNFARVHMIRLEGERLYRLPLEISEVRRVVLNRVRSAEDLDRAFQEYATTEQVLYS